MTRFNPHTKKNSNKTVNHEGGKAFKVDDPRIKLYSLVCTSVLSPKYYEPRPSDQIKRIRKLIPQCDPVFVAKLAKYAREEMHLRTIPLVLAVELAKHHNGDDTVRRMVRGIIQRADELTEILAYYQLANGTAIRPRDGVKKLYKISSQLKKGVADAFDHFDEYQFAKYHRNDAGKEVKLKDVLSLVRPKPKDVDQADLFNKILNGNLAAADTWEKRSSEAGKESQSKKEMWEGMIDSGKMGYMATLRNLRNFIEADISNNHIVKVADYLSNEKAVRNSKQFPFRFLSAYKALIGQRNTVADPKTKVLIDALEKAAMVSVKNVDLFKNKSVLIASDVSGSMRQRVSPKSDILNVEIGLLLSMLTHNACRFVTTGIFGNDWMPINFSSNTPLSNTMEATVQYANRVGLATHGYKVLEWASQKNYDYDYIMFFSDMQLYGDMNAIEAENSWLRYKKSHPQTKLYMFDLAGYETVPFNPRNNDVTLISGWSDKIFDMLYNIEQGSSVVEEIEKVKL